MADDVVEQEAQETKPSKAERKAERLQAATEKNKELRGTVVDDVRALGESAMRKIKEKGEGDQSDDETEAATGAQPQVHRADVLVVLLEIRRSGDRQRQIWSRRCRRAGPHASRQA